MSLASFSRRRHAPDSNPVAVRQLDVVMMMEDLQVVEADRNQAEHADHQRSHRRDARIELRNRPTAI